MTATLEVNPTYFIAHVDLRPLEGGRCLAVAPSGQAYELDASPEYIADLLAKCDGEHSLDEILKGHDRADDLREVFEALASEGFLSERPTVPSPLQNLELHLVGDPELISEVASLVTQWRAVHRHVGYQIPQIPDPDSAVIVALSPYIDGDWLKELDTHARKINCCWTQLHFDSSKGWLGPFVIPGRTSDYEDLMGRRRCSGDDVEGAQMRRPLLPEEGAPNAPFQPPVASRRWMLSLLFAEVEKAISDGDCRMLSCELEADPVTFSLTPHHILPLPTRAPDDWLATPASARERVVDSRTGIILSQHKVPHHPSLPASLTTVRSHCTDLSRIYPWGNDLFTGGSTFGDEASAAGAALGEALERYCGNCLPGVEMVTGSWRDFMGKNRRALDPESLILHSQKMMDEPGCPFKPFSRDLSVQWVRGRSLTRNEPCLLPLSLVYANWMGGDINQAVTNYLYTPGMAAGETLEQALVGAVRELVERDITMAWWLNAHPLSAVAPTPALDALWKGVPESEDQIVRYIHLDNPFNIPVIVACVEHRKHQFLNIGFGCRPDPEYAASKALTEALTLQEGSRDLLSPDSMLRRSSEEWGLLSVPYKPRREDRTYMDAFRPDFRDINDLMLQQQFFLDPRALEKVRHLTMPPVTRTFDQLPRLEDDRFETYRKPIEDAGFEILYADITSPDVALAGYRVVRVIIPGLIPNMPAAFPAVGGKRVFELPVQMGWRDTPLREEELHYFPMPHA